MGGALKGRGRVGQCKWASEGGGNGDDADADADEVSVDSVEGVGLGNVASDVAKVSPRGAPRSYRTGVGKACKHGAVKAL